MSQRRAVVLTLAAAVSASSAIAAGAATAPASGAALPKIGKLAVHHGVLTSAGGPYTVKAPVKGAVRCTATVKPAITPKPGVRCAHGTLIAKFTLPANTRTSSQPYLLTLRVIGAARRSVSKSVTLRVPPPLTTPGGPTPTPTHVSTPLHFSIGGATGLALTSGSATGAWRAADTSTTGSNLETVSSTGQTTDAVTTGHAVVSKFLIAPSGHLYVVFSGRVNLTDTSMYSATGCLLAEIDPSTGTPTCVDSTLASIDYQLSGGSLFSGQPIQFDGSGAVYYAGRSASGTTVLRKYLNGTATDLINDGIDLHQFLVRPAGDVFLTGSTNSTGVYWVRHITAQGSLETIVATTWADFIQSFPDGNVYIGAVNNWAVKRWLPATSALDGKEWIALDSSSNPSAPPAYFYTGDLCASQHGGFCGTAGAQATNFMRTPDGKEYAVDPDSQIGGALVEYYPTVGFPATGLTNVTVAQGVLSDIIVAGLDASSHNVLNLYNTTNDTYTQLIPPTNEVEIYHLNYVANGNKILFDGLRFSDNKYVLGEVDLDTDNVNMVPTNAAKWADFQTFG